LKTESKKKVSATYSHTFSISEAEHTIISTQQHFEPPSVDLLTVKYLPSVHSLIRCSTCIFQKGVSVETLKPPKSTTDKALFVVKECFNEALIFFAKECAL